MQSAVTVSLVEEARGGPFVFWHDLPAACKAARALDFHGIEFFPPSGDALNSAATGKLLDDHGLELAAVGTGAGWVMHRLNFTLADAAARAKAIAFVRRVIDFAGSLGAPAIIGSMQGRSGDGVDPATAKKYLVEALETLGEHARQYAAPLLFEPLNRYETNMVNTIESGLELLHSLSTSNVLLLADLFHMNIEEVDVSAALRSAAGQIGHVHLADSNRRPAGLGHTDFAPIGKTLKDIGYSGFVSAEAFPYPDSRGAAQQTIAAFKQFFVGQP